MLSEALAEWYARGASGGLIRIRRLQSWFIDPGSNSTHTAIAVLASASSMKEMMLIKIHARIRATGRGSNVAPGTGIRADITHEALLAGCG